MAELLFTGERFLSHLDYPEIAYEHWHRYLYASAWVTGKSVLDIASGEGYGSFFLAQTASRVLGVDISPEAVLHAATHYLAANLEFAAGSVARIPVEAAQSFDVIVSFETIEHVSAEEQRAFLREVRRLLKPDGVFIVSTPNKELYSDLPQYKNEYHVREFYRDEFRDFLGKSFRHVEMLGQKIYPASVIWNLAGGERPWRETHLEQTAHGLRPTDASKGDLYDIAVCSDAPVAGADHAVMLDLSERIWRLREHRIQVLEDARRQAQKDLEEKDECIARLQAQLQEKALVPAAQAPATDVSIVIPLFNHAETTRACLEALARNTPASRYEVVLVDNASTDATPELLASLEGDVKIIRNEKNEGFVWACNLGARAAAGRYLLFLNNDTLPQPGWLEAMLRLADRDPQVGAVGAKLVYPDGKLQEAGGILFQDGSGWNFGRGDNPAKEIYSRPVEVDYCSGACLLVRRELFERLGGFDLRFAPAYYEDTDLCFALRQLGFKVMFCPDAVVVHCEGVTAGTDLTTGFKRYQAIHQETFVRKWRAELQQQEPSPQLSRLRPTTADRARLHAVVPSTAPGMPSLAGLKVLVVDPTLPMHDRASGCLRLFSILKIMRQQGCEVTFLAVEGGPTRYRRELEVMGIRVIGPDPARASAAKGGSLDLKALLRTGGFQVAWLSFYHIAEQYLPVIRRELPGARIVVDTVDVHFLRERRRAELENDPGLRAQAEEVRQRELDIYRRADACVVVTPDDQRVLEPEVAGKPLWVVPNIHELQPEAPAFALRSGLLFVGNFNHPPNQDAVLFFIRDVLPLVRRSLPEIKFYIVGDHPPQAVQDLAGDNIIITGYVPKTDPYLNLSRISVAPLRYGAGMKGKIGEALSHGLPVVTTPVGAEGMGLRPGEDLLVAEGAEAFARAIIGLYGDPVLWERLARNGRAHIESRFSPTAVAAQVQAVFQSLEAGAGREELTSLVVLTHNQVRVTRACLESIRAHTREPYELIVVDNASSDGTLDYLRSLEAEQRLAPHPFCRRFAFLANETNRGFALGNNQGLAVAKGENVVMLNNDVVVTPGWLGRLLACARHNPGIGLVGPMTNYVSGPQKVEHPGYALDTLAGLDDFAQTWAREHAGEALPHWRVVGFCLLVKRAVLEKVGGLDGRFGLGNFEDDDFSLRAALAGFASCIARDCYVHHVGSQTFADLKLDYRQSLEKNWDIFKSKWGLPASVQLGSNVDLSPILREGFREKHFVAYR